MEELGFEWILEGWKSKGEGSALHSPATRVVTVAGSHVTELPHGGASNQRPLPTSFSCTLSSRPVLRCF